jgi:hypothetical protein
LDSLGEVIGAAADEDANLPHSTAIKAMTTVWNSANAVAEATAGVPVKTPVTITRATPTSRTEVAITMALALPLPPSSQPAATLASRGTAKAWLAYHEDYLGNETLTDEE